MKAKLNDDQTLTLPTRLYHTEQEYLEKGFKNYRSTFPPKEQEGFFAACHYEETEDEIVQIWSLEEGSSKTDIEKILMGEYD